MPHLDERTLALHVLGEDVLDPQQQAHLDGCAECAGIVAELAGVVDADSTGDETGPPHATPAAEPVGGEVPHPDLSGPRTPDGRDVGQPGDAPAPLSVAAEHTEPSPSQATDRNPRGRTWLLPAACLILLVVVWVALTR